GDESVVTAPTPRSRRSASCDHRLDGPRNERTRVPLVSDGDSDVSQAIQALAQLLPVRHDPGHQAMTDEIFGRAKRVATKFQEGLTQLFFHTNNELTSTTQVDGVF